MRDAPSSGRFIGWTPLYIAAGYVLVGMLWIVYSDSLAAFLIQDKALLTQVSIYKGLGYVIVTGLLLFLLLRTVLGHVLRAQRDLAESERRFRALYEQSLVGFAMVDLETRRITAANPAYCAMTGYTQVELRSQDAFNLSFPEDRALEESAWRGHTRPGGRYVIEKRLRRKDGTPLWVLKTGTILCGADGRPLCQLAMVQDIDERKRASQRVVMLAAAVEQTADAVLLTDTGGVTVYANSAFEQASGYTVAEATGQLLLDLRHDNTDRAQYAQVLEQLQQGRNWRGKFGVHRRDGSRYEVETIAIPVRDAGGQVVNFCIIERDITREQSLEAQLRQAQKLEAIGTLAGGIAHDFNNLLFSMLGCAELAQLDVPPDSAAWQNLQDIQQAGARASELVRQILSFARRSEPVVQHVRLDRVAQEVLQLIRTGLSEGIELRADLAATAAWVLADPTELHQVLMNLCSNACYAMRKTGGVLELRLDTVEPDEYLLAQHPLLKPRAYARISVADTGPGVPREHQQRIFEPFFTTKSVGEGTGMGLSVVHGIVTALGGTVTLYSEPGQGAVFRIYLPLAPAPASEAAASARPAAPHGQGRILVVDDEETLVRMLQAMLGSLGYSAAGFTSGEVALAEFQRDPQAYQLLLTDQAMPGMSGAELAQAVLALRPELPVVLCTGFSHTLAPEDAASAGLSAYVMKPVLRDDLAQVLHGLLGTPSPAE